MNRILLLFAALFISFNAFSEGDCEGLDLTLESSIVEGGPAFLAWEIVNDEGVVVDDGIAQFSMEDPDYSADICLEWGCYTLNLSSDGIWDPTAISIDVVSNDVEVSISELTIGLDGISLDFGVATDCESDCPVEFGYEVSDDCLTYTFFWTYEPGDDEFAETTYAFGDGTFDVTTDMFSTHTYAEPGEYEVTSTFSAEGCGIGVTTSTETIVVEDCSGPCELDVEIVQASNCGGTLILEAYNYPENAILEWSVNEVIVDDDNLLEYELTDPGIYVVCVAYETPECPEGVFWCEGFTIEDCGEGCPEEYGAFMYNQCGCWGFEIGSFEEGEEVLWNWGDGTTSEGGHFAEHCYNENGVYSVIAEYSSPDCEGETYVMEVVVDCFNFGCDLDIEVVDEGCGIYLFEAFGFPEEAYIEWFVDTDDSVFEGGTHIIDVLFEEAGGHWVCATYETPECPEGVTYCVEFYVELCEEGCPEEIWMDDTEECGCYVFEIGSFVEGESVVWDWGDGTFTEGGHFAEHCYEVDGEYVVTAWYTSPTCEGMLYTLGVANVNCEQECYNVAIGLDSYPDLGGPEAVQWHVQNDGNEVMDGECVYENNNFCDIGLCLPTGCYFIILNSWAQLDNPELFNWNFGGENVTWVGEPGFFKTDEGYWTVSIPFAVNNAECGEQDCELDVEIVSAPECGGLFALEAYNYPENASIYWSINEDYIDDDHFLEYELNEPGEYQICAAYETPECPEGVFWCETFVVEDCGDCPNDIWMDQMGDCGCYVFEIGSFVEGEEVLWDWGDGSTTEGGHFAEHCYEQDGEYIVTAWYTSPTCEGMLYTLGVADVECDQDCYNVGLGFDSYPDLGGPYSLAWEISTNLVVLESGECSYEENNYCDAGVCLPTGCYTLSIYTTAEEWDVDDAFQWFLEGENVTWVGEPEYFVDMMGYLFIFVPFEVNNAGCGEGDCYLEIDYVEAEGGYVFWAEAPSDGTVTWEFCDGTVLQGWEVFWQVELEYDCTVCAIYESDNCLEDACIEIEVEGGDDCPDETWIGEMNECGCYNFEIGSFAEGEEVDWYFGDGTIVENGGHYVEHCFPDGVWTVTAYYESNDCEGQEYFLGVVEVNCGSDCFLEIEYDQIDNDSYLFSGAVPEGATITWDFGDGTMETANIADHTFEPGVWTVCATYETEDCPFTIECFEIIVTDVEGDCPEDIYVGEQDDCGCYEFEIGSFVEGENVLWDFGNGVTYEGGHYVDYCYEEDGEYLVTAWYTSPVCEGMFYEFGVLVVDCDPCDLEVEVVDEGCGAFIFEAWDYPENATLFWEIGDNIYAEDTHVIDVLFEEEGIYEVTVFYETPECPMGVFVTVTVEVDLCEDDCPEELYVGEANECGCYEFEIGSFVEGENVDWDFGDNDIANDEGHYITHCYDEDGVYIITANYTSPLCPDGATFTATVEVDCEDDCTEVGFAMDALNDNVTELVWTLYLEDVAMEDGICEYTPNQSYCDAALCLEPGCYTMVLDANEAITDDSFFYGAFINEYAIDLYDVTVSDDQHVVTYSFGVDSDCESSVEEIQAYQWSIYPVPASESLIIEVDNHYLGYQIAVFDMNGKQVVMDKVGGIVNTISLNSIADGIYSLVLFNEMTMESLRLSVIK